MLADAPVDPAVLPVGFRRFHRRSFLNYQLNRAHALGFADAEELRATAASLSSRAECASAFQEASLRAERQGRLRNATSYLRIAEFFTPCRASEKVAIYRRYRDLFDAGFSVGGATRHDVAYGGSTIPAYWLPAIGGASSGTVLIHGGFDSLIEEFFAIWQRVAAAGFDVVAFDGPGQGGARALGGLTFDHDWEKPVGAVLDHFGIDTAALVGISMGGYWALRAAAFEPRIARVVSWPPVYDWIAGVPAPARGVVRAMLRRRGFMSWSVRFRTRLSPTLRQVVEQALYLVDSDEPLAAVDWFLGMNADHLASERVTQDVFVMCGENDAFQSPRLARLQVEALTAARTITTRTFTKAEHADQHCQMGNLDLACHELTGWLRHTQPGATP